MHFQPTVVESMDEVYTAQQVEFQSGRFYGYENQTPKKTLLCLMLKSVASQYCDVVAMIPLSGIDSSIINADGTECCHQWSQLDLMLWPPLVLGKRTCKSIWYATCTTHCESPHYLLPLRVLLEAGLLLVGGRRARAGAQRGALHERGDDVQVDSGLGALGTAQIVYSATFPEAVRYSCINRKF